MFRLRSMILNAAALFIAAGVCTSLSAATFQFAGSFTRDDQTQFYRFDVVQPSLVNLGTTSFTSGGFSPVLSLFTATGTNPLIGRDNGVDRNGDANLSISLMSGTYFLALTQYDNLAAGPGLGDGFLRQGDATFTREFSTTGATGPFLDIDGQQRTGVFAVTLANVENAASVVVPEPSAAVLSAVGAVLVLFSTLRRRT